MAAEVNFRLFLGVLQGVRKGGGSQGIKKLHPFRMQLIRVVLFSNFFMHQYRSIYFGSRDFDVAV
jgi:hypothetical protein